MEGISAGWLCGTAPLLKDGHLEQAVQDLVQMASEYLQRWRLNNLSWQPVAVLSQPSHSQKVFLAVQSPSFFYLWSTVSTRTPRHLYAKVFSSRVAPSMLLVRRVVLSQVQDFVFPIVELCAG